MTLRTPAEASVPVDVSVVCPFYNEEQIIKQAVTGLLAKLDELQASWELIVVNDGSRDRSAEVVAELCPKHPQLRLVGYPLNRGRGHALRTGIAEARGAVIVTTEIDLSWGEDIVQRLYDAMLQHPECDIVVASPHLKGGGYRNVPFKRRMVSQLGNWVIRACMTNVTTMNTGMTRAYRREIIQSMPLEEDRKEFHLEVILKAQAMGYRMIEIPAFLEWKDYKHQGRQVKRKSSSKVNKLIVTHSLFSIFANPIRYVWGMSMLSMLGSVAFFVIGVIRLLMGLVSVYMLIVSLALAIISLVFFTFGVIAYQGNAIQKEIWTLKRELRRRDEATSSRPDSDAQRRVM